MNSIVNSLYYDTLVLSGGSIKGIIMLGALEYIYLINNNNFKYYIGTSVGAIIGYLLAIGYNPIDLIIYLCKEQLFDENLNIESFIFQHNGIFSFDIIQKHLEKLTLLKLGKYITLKELYNLFNKHFIAITYNLTKDKIEILDHETFPDLSCITAVKMSANLPLIFEKFEYMQNQYIDGGIANNFALDIGVERGKRILGIMVKDNTYEKQNNNNFLNYIYKLIFIPIIQANEYKINLLLNENLFKEKCTILKIITTDKINFIDFNLTIKQKLDMFSFGFNYAKNNLP